MKLFDRHGGYWLFWTGAIYLAVGVTCAVYYKEVPASLIQLGWLLVMSMPLYFPPLGRWLNMSVDWDIKMFDFFRRKTAKDYLDEASNVYNLPKPKAVPPMPEVTPPKKEEAAKIFYRFGMTDNNRVAFSMGYSEITMNRAGCQQMIDQLEFFKGQLHDEDDTDGGPDGGGGEPVPVPEQKAA